MYRKKTKSTVHKWDKSCTTHKLVFIIGSICHFTSHLIQWRNLLIQWWKQIVHNTKFVSLVHIRQNIERITLSLIDQIHQSFKMNLKNNFFLIKWTSGSIIDNHKRFESQQNVLINLKRWPLRTNIFAYQPGTEPKTK
jgi:hypothetical protein